MKSKGQSLIWLVILIYLGLLIKYFFWFDGGFSDDNADWGTFGDFLGGALSPIIGIISVVLTYKIINNQNIQDRQTEFKYMFEILFDAIAEKKEMISRTDSKTQSSLKGDDALIRVNKDIESLYKGSRLINRNRDALETMREAFWSVHGEINASSAPFMKNIHNCLKVIDKHCVEEHKKEYADLLRAQLSKEELVFIFYNALADDSFNNFKLRIEKYSILKDVFNHPFNRALKKRYSSSAFSDTDRGGKVVYYKFKPFGFELEIKLIIPKR